jgi:uncharacterized membrane protein YiaA
MTTKTYLIAYGLYFLTLLLAFFYISVPYYRAKWENTGQRFSFSKFWNSSWNVNIGNLILGVLFLFVWNLVVEYFKLNATKEVLYALCMVIAAFGGPAVVKKWGRAQKYFDEFVDKKLPVADEEKK